MAEELLRATAGGGDVWPLLMGFLWGGVIFWIGSGGRGSVGRGGR